MPIEIRELVIKVKVDENAPAPADPLEIQKMRQAILKECRKEIKKQLSKSKER